MTHRILVAKDFSPYPVGRNKLHGDNHGGRFRTEVLIPALDEHDHVTIDFTGVAVNVGPSFLDESVAGLVWNRLMTEEEVRRRVSIVIPEDETMVAAVWQWVHEAEMHNTGEVEGAATAGDTLRHVAYG